MFDGYRRSFYHAFRLEPEQKLFSRFVNFVGNVFKSARMNARAYSPVSDVHGPVTLVFVGSGRGVFSVPAGVHPDIVERKLVFFDTLYSFDNRACSHSAPYSGAKRTGFISSGLTYKRKMSLNQPSPFVYAACFAALVRHYNYRRGAELFARFNIKFCILNARAELNFAFGTFEPCRPLTCPAHGEKISPVLLMNAEKRSVPIARTPAGSTVIALFAHADIAGESVVFKFVGIAIKLLCRPHRAVWSVDFSRLFARRQICRTPAFFFADKRQSAVAVE